MLELIGIDKNYQSKYSSVRALNNINLTFRESEYVSVLGPSGCGKTTLLNIIGGLDRYSSGDLKINGISTTKYKDKNWDTYRNHSIGFVFQSYNLIPHLTVLGNVEIALTISGVSIQERRERSLDVLKRVGLEDQIHKRPNQLSGGQMQRVAIARALINNPKIILADEPTGALDTETSIQVLDILKEVAKDKLVIMVTHNEKLAQRYSTRVVYLLDGNLQGDTNPVTAEEKIQMESKLPEILAQEAHKKNPSMSFLTALRLSLKNLTSKRGRTIMTSAAGSIGIIGISMILAISNGLTNYMNSITNDDVSAYPISISDSTYDISAATEYYLQATGIEKYPQNTDAVIVYRPSTLNSFIVTNEMSEEFLTYIDDMDESFTQYRDYTYAVDLNVVYQKVDNSYGKLSGSSGWQEMIGNQDMVNNQYDVLYGDGLPTSYGELAVCVDSYNRLSETVLTNLGIDSTDRDEISYDEIVGLQYKLILNDDYYNENSGVFTRRTDFQAMYEDENAITMTIKSILRNKKSSSNSYLRSGLVYTKALTEFVIEDSSTSAIGLAQIANPTIDVTKGTPFVQSISSTGIVTVEDKYRIALQDFGMSRIPIEISLYAVDYKSKQAIRTYLDQWNVNHATDETKQIIYTDLATTISSMLSTLINVISYVLIAFSGISLVVSSVMIGIITFVSVIERTKEIGVLRSIGASKNAIKRVFNAETIIIGFIAGVIGVVFSLLISLPINAIVFNLAEVENISALPVLTAVILITISILLTYIAGLVPASAAAKKDPVTALRTE